MIKKSILALLAVFIALPLYAATNFPTSIDTYADKNASDVITSSGWNNMQDAIESLETKVGADSSADSTSHDYKIDALVSLANTGNIPVSINTKTATCTIQAADANMIYIASSTGAMSITLPSAAAVSSGDWIRVFNAGAGTVSIVGTINGTTSHTLFQYGDITVYSNGSAWYGPHWTSSSTTTPTANKIARWDANAVMQGAELNMTGEASAKSTTDLTQLETINVTTGDRIFYSARGYMSSSSAGAFTFSVGKGGGSATIAFDHDGTGDGCTVQGNAGAHAMRLSGVIRVTGSGTLLLQSGMVAPATATYTLNQIYIYFLKKG
jgi:hypothetical protein